MDRITNTIYQGYVNIPKDSDNRFDICEPIFTEKEVELMAIRLHHNQKHYGFKHEYKFRNKVIIDGQTARHQKQTKKSGKVYNYYYIKGGTFINEKTLIELVTTKAADKYREEVGKLENTIKDLAHELSIGSITKDEFDYKYKKIMENNKPQKLKFEHIYVTTRYIDGEKELEYRIE